MKHLSKKSILFLVLLIAAAAPLPLHAYRINQERIDERYQKMTPEERKIYEEKIKDRNMRRYNRQSHKRDKILSRSERLDALRKHDKEQQALKEKKRLEKLLQKQRLSDHPLPPEPDDKPPAVEHPPGMGVGARDLDLQQEMPGAPGEGGMGVGTGATEAVPGAAK